MNLGFRNSLLKVLKESALLAMTLSVALALAADICEYQMNGVRLLHPADCNKFVECKNGKTDRIMSCPLGLHFNRFKSLCDLKQRAACDIDFINFANEDTNCSACCARYGCFVNPDCPEAPGTPAVSTETPATTENPTIPDNPTTDTAATSKTVTIPDNPTTDTSVTSEDPTIPDNPTTDTAATAATPESTIKPDTSAATIVTDKPATPETPPPATEAPTTNGGNCSNNLTDCIGKADGAVAHADGTCNQYIVCVAGCAKIMSCPNNLQYNIATGSCDNPKNVACPWPSASPITGPSGVTCANRGMCAAQYDGKLFADTNSNGYIVCQCECEIKIPCPVGTKFNEQLLTCAAVEENGNGHGKGNDYITKLVCPNDIQICKNQTEGALFPIQGVCNKFYKCNFGCAIEILCPNNLIYNPKVGYCDYPQNYKCPWSHTALSEPSAGPCGIACSNGARCTGQTDGALFPSRTSCSKYVVCQCECEIEMKCPKDLVWDSQFLTCNYPTNVTCESF